MASSEARARKKDTGSVIAAITMHESKFSTMIYSPVKKLGDIAG
jgi:hypothetical protein